VPAAHYNPCPSGEPAAFTNAVAKLVELRADTSALCGPLTCRNCPVVHYLHHFEGTSEIQRMLIGRAVTGLDVR
jgi:alkylation response protein AidB-like acyl-CoA dehydrogenase